MINKIIKKIITIILSGLIVCTSTPAFAQIVRLKNANTSEQSV